MSQYGGVGMMLEVEPLEGLGVELGGPGAVNFAGWPAGVDRRDRVMLRQVAYTRLWRMVAYWHQARYNALRASASDVPKYRLAEQRAASEINKIRRQWVMKQGPRDVP